jgi:hypothetical protein
MALDRRLLTVVAVLVLLASLAFSEQAVSLARANPLMPPLVRVDSPQNNKIYPSNDVPLIFIVIPSNTIILTSFTYSIDGQEPKATNGSTALTNLAAESHKLTIYGKGFYAYSSNQTYESVADVVYFSTGYSSAVVTVIAILAAATSLISLTVFALRRRLPRLLRGRRPPASG